MSRKIKSYLLLTGGILFFIAIFVLLQQIIQRIIKNMNISKTCLLFSLSFIFLFCSFQPEEPTTKPEMAKSEVLPTDTVLTDSPTVTEKTDSNKLQLYTIVGVGDMMLGTNYPNASYLPANGGKDLLRDLHPVLQNADVTFGNLEGTLLNEGGKVKRCSNPDLCYAFRSPENYICLLYTSPSPRDS